MFDKENHLICRNSDTQNWKIQSETWIQGTIGNHKLTIPIFSEKMITGVKTNLVGRELIANRMNSLNVDMEADISGSPEPWYDISFGGLASAGPL